MANIKKKAPRYTVSNSHWSDGSVFVGNNVTNKIVITAQCSEEKRPYWLSATLAFFVYWVFWLVALILNLLDGRDADDWK